MKEWQKHLIGAASVVVVCGVVFWPVVSGRATVVATDILYQLTLPLGAHVTVPHLQNHYHMDSVCEIYPNCLFWVDCLQRGQSPIWNPFIWAGFPCFALSTYSLACPFNVLFVLLPMPAAFNWWVLAQFMASGVFMYLLVRYWGLSVPACLLGAIAYALNTEFLFLYWNPTIRAFVWAPLVLLFYDKTLCSGRVSAAVMTGFFTALAAISGSIQTTVSVLFMLGLYGLATAVVRRREVRFRRIVSLSALAVAVALLAAAGQLLPCLEFLNHNANERLTQGRSSSFWNGLGAIPFLSTFIVPGLWGSTESFDLLKAIRSTAGDFQGYIGAASFAMLLIAVAVRRESTVGVLALAAVSVVGLLVFSPFLRRYLYYRFLIAYVVFAAGLAAWGLDWLLRYSPSDQPSPEAQRVRRWLKGLAAFLLAVAVGLLVVQTAYAIWCEPLTNLVRRQVLQRAAASDALFASEKAWFEARVDVFWQHYRLSNSAFWIPLATGIAAVAVVLVRLRGRLRRSCGWILFGLVALDLGILTARLMPMVDLQKYPPYPHMALTDELQQSAMRVYRSPAPGRLIMQDDLLMAYRVQSLGGYASLKPLTLEQVLINSGKETNAIALGACAVSHLLARTNTPSTDPAFQPVLQQDGVTLYHNTAVLPRARFVSQYRPVINLVECQALMSRPDWQPQTQTPIETSRQPNAQGPTKASVSIVSETTTMVDLAVQTDSSGFVILADTYYPGWRVTVDGQPAEIHRAYWAARAVYVEPGIHEVRFVYAPSSLRVGAIISGVTVLLGLGVCVIEWLRGTLR